MVSCTTHWPWPLSGVAVLVGGLRWYLRTREGAEAWDGFQLKLPIVGPVAPRRSVEPLRVDPGNTDGERGAVASGAENRRKHDRKPRIGTADSACGGGDLLAAIR